MYVWARMLATARSRGPYMMGGEGRPAFRCLPTDYDRKARRFLDIDAVVAALGRAVNRGHRPRQNAFS
ncbi:MULTISPECIES: hypothetical protein [unclassified Mesorhizobium]|uniref:hypothetical protein n=1 Tax=unclassified Mesorhizobium TaxID=325217 RepID=UPI001CCA08B8|nr:MULTISPECIES: hypothetical protein [unclassified Mesorhizobium]MBZ9682975.1 hypothetical protein [Mesorhizobium sp. CO1-1-2]MBZ9698055.1 hypothetical protein [Mesorhizobium sp. CO1-1-9]MBZ9924495.1 hypothetical protein [Mesorhizobium sp. BR1-1-4]